MHYMVEFTRYQTRSFVVEVEADSASHARERVKDMAAGQVPDTATLTDSEGWVGDVTATAIDDDDADLYAPI